MTFKQPSKNKTVCLIVAAIITIVFIVISHARGDEGTYLKFSADPAVQGFKGQGASLGYQDELLFLEKKVEAGFWTDQDSLNGGGSLYAQFSVGVEPSIGGIRLGLFQGIGIVTNPGTRLRGCLQFFSEINLGFQDSREIYLGLFAEHIGFAGILGPETGKDSIGVKARIPW